MASALKGRLLQPLNASATHTKSTASTTSSPLTSVSRFGPSDPKADATKTRSRMLTVPSPLTSVAGGGGAVSEITLKYTGSSITHPAAVAETVCIPTSGPSVSVLRALPVPSVVACVTLSVPLPAVMANVTGTPS